VTTNDQANFAAAKPISAGFPADRPQLWPVAGSGFYYWAPRRKNIHDVRVEHQRAARAVRHLVVSVAYVGGKGTYVDAVGLNINQAVPGPGAVVTRRPYPNLSDALAWCRGAIPITIRCRPRSTGEWEVFDFPAAWSGPIASMTQAGIQQHADSEFAATCKRNVPVPLSISGINSPSTVVTSCVRQRKAMAGRCAKSSRPDCGGLAV